MLKFIFKWLLRLAFLAVVLVVIALLSYNSILRLIIERNIRAQTGMDAEIGSFHLALTEPTIEIRNLKIYNTKEFGGTQFLDIPEIHVEYDRDALLKKQIHVTLMRFNLGELDIVKNEAGKTNLFELGVAGPKTSGKAPPQINFKHETGYDFTRIDVLNVSVGTAKFVDLKNPKNNHAQKIDIQNCIIKDVKSENDLAGLMVFVALRGGDFFTTTFGGKSLQTNTPAGVNGILNLLGGSL
ncbi:MAG TPA: hypothetical protein VFV23_12735 [Verrucomicrobiae bacterium]|nr:hypothetical protein [Verrucomicrobiae bacterium]